MAYDDYDELRDALDEAERNLQDAEALVPTDRQSRKAKKKLINELNRKISSINKKLNNGDWYPS